MIALLLKVTFVLVLALCAQGFLRRASAAMRHLVCAAALLLAGLMLLTLLIPAKTEVLRIPLPIFTASAARAVTTRGWLTLVNPLLSLWALGAALLLVRLIVGHWRVSRLRRNATRFDLAGNVPVFRADVDIPVAIGLTHPAILLPASAAEWSAGHQVAALRHETAHINRKDLWTNLLAHVVCAVYWFHPLVWALAHRLREEQELACDDAALTAGTPPHLYAEALLAAARFTRPPVVTSLIGCPMITRASLKNRITRVVDASLPRTLSRSSLWRTATLIAISGVCVGLVTAEQQAPAQPAPETEKVYRVGQGVSAPRLLSRSEPEYTEEARAAKIDGTVLLQIVVGADGLAHHINVIKGLDAGLDIKAVEAVQRWRFVPGELDGHPVDIRAQIEINFKLL